MEDQKNTGNTTPKRRSLTSLTLGWIAERLRRTEALKEQVKSGSYSINSQSVAKSLVSVNEEEK